MLSLSSHKIYGPKGVGALYIKEGITLEKFLNGGHQEKDRRAGTENTAGIVGFGKAAELAKENIDEHKKKKKYLRNYYVEQITNRIPNIKINGPLNARLPGNSNISFENINASDLLLELDNSRNMCIKWLCMQLKRPCSITCINSNITARRFNKRSAKNYIWGF